MDITPGIPQALRKECPFWPSSLRLRVLPSTALKGPAHGVPPQHHRPAWQTLLRPSAVPSVTAPRTAHCLPSLPLTAPGTDTGLAGHHHASSPNTPPLGSRRAAMVTQLGNTQVMPTATSAPSWRADPLPVRARPGPHLRLRVKGHEGYSTLGTHLGCAQTSTMDPSQQGAVVLLGGLRAGMPTEAEAAREGPRAKPVTYAP